MFSLIENIEEDKKEYSPVGMRNILQELNISYSTLYRWTRYKGFPCYKVQGSNSTRFHLFVRYEKYLTFGIAC